MAPESVKLLWDAIAQTVEQIERDDEFDRIAEECWVRMLTTGETVPWDTARTYLEARARGASTPRPSPVAR